MVPPLLGVTRAAIAAYAEAHALRHVDDPSNGDKRWRRNAVRGDVAPAWRAAMPGYPATIARAAEHQADAAALLDALAERDAQDAGYDAAAGSFAAATLVAARRCARAKPDALVPAPSRASAALVRAASRDGRPARARARRRRDRDRARRRDRGPASRAGRRARTRPARLRRAVARRGGGAAPARRAALRDRRGPRRRLRTRRAGLAIRPRRGGERLQLAGDRTRRALKSILRESSLPTWERDALPLVVAGDVLVAVPGIGVDVAWQAAPGRPGKLPVWRVRP
jgi:tRNA(Ile)-lysidine synthase